MTTAAKTETEDPTARRILDAALEQFTVFGLRRSSMDDVAKRAGVSRVTVYRRFGTRTRWSSRPCCARTAGSSSDWTKRWPRCRPWRNGSSRGSWSPCATPAPTLFGGLLRLEPEVVLPYLTVHGGSSLAATVDYLTGHLRRAQQAEGRPGDDPRPVAELMVRVAVSFLLNPASCIEMDDEDQARAFARRYLAPLLNA